MAQPPRKRRPVVAERRYANPKKPSGTTPKGKRGRRAPVRRGNAITRGVTGFFSLIWKAIFRTVWFSALAVFLIIAMSTFFYYSQLPEPSALFDGRARGGVTMLDREGKVFAWRGETFGTVMPDQISPALRDAVGTEDRRFYSHLGIDPRGIASAVKINMSEGAARWRVTAARPLPSRWRNCSGSARPSIRPSGATRPNTNRIAVPRPCGGRSRRCPSPSRWR